MANYIFETTTDGGSFTSADHLIFSSATASMVGAQDAPGFTDALGTHAESITLTANNHALTFSADALHAASAHGNIVFLNGDSLLVGTAAAETLTLNDVGHGHGAVVYGFDGNDIINDNSTSNDTINGGGGDDVINGSSSYTDATGHFVETDFYQGGAGADTITGGNGNDHIYGNVAVGSAGMPDGADSIMAGDGNDYVNGNAGNDRIVGGNGNDRLYGGNGDDTISGQDGNDYLQGNRGNDHLYGGAGDDTLHGGADNDFLQSGFDAHDHNQLWGDLGDDTLVGGDGSTTFHGGAGDDSLSGGNGIDTFVFAAGDAKTDHLTTDPGTTASDIIDDFADGTDHISLGFTVSAVVHGQAGVTFDSATAAMAYAQTLLSNSTGTHGTEVAAVTLGSDTYLFWDDTHTSATIDATVRLVGITDDKINVGSHSDFI